MGIPACCVQSPQKWRCKVITSILCEVWMLSRLAICSLARLSSVAWSATTVIGWHCQKCPHQLLSCVSNADSAATVFPVCCRCQATQTVFKAQRCYVPHPQLCSTASVIVTSHWTQEITGVSKPKESNLLNLFLLRSLSLSLLQHYCHWRWIPIASTKYNPESCTNIEQTPSGGEQNAWKLGVPSSSATGWRGPAPRYPATRVSSADKPYLEELNILRWHWAGLVACLAQQDSNSILPPCYHPEVAAFLSKFLFPPLLVWLARAMAIFPMTFTADKSSNLPRALFLKPMCGLPHFAISNWGRLGVTQPRSPGQTHCAHRHRPAANTGPEEDKAARLDTEHSLPPVTFSRHYNVPGCGGWEEGWAWGSNAGLS